jgi:hypothetical protein
VSDAVGRLRVVLLGYVVRYPLAGMAWHSLHYVLGLAQLGHDVWFVEDSDDYDSCYDPATGMLTADPTAGLAFTAAAFDRLGLPDRWAYHDARTASWHGPASAGILDVCRSADVVINLAGIHPLRPWLAEVPARIFIDADPVFTQVRHLTSPQAAAAAARHTAFFSFGEGIAAGTSAVPDDGFAWQATRQPVVLDAWPVTPPPTGAAFTTVMNWDSYPPVEHDGVRYGMKSQGFVPYLDLPARVGPRLEVALGGGGSERLVEHGWGVRDGAAATRDLQAYQDYLQASAGEFSVAKHGYVVSRSGWFSERSACYLASGRPAVVQDTGFSAWLPTGCGLLAFSTPDDAAAALADVLGDCARHAAAAREVAAAHFDAGAVLTRLLADAGAA